MRWTEVYSDPQSDVNKYSSSLARGVPGGVLDLLCALPRDHAPGTNWLYNTGDTFLLGSVLTAAIKRPLASYLAEKIWGPCGCEQDAYYTLESPEGQEIGGSRAGVTLRDLSRFANFVLNDGVAPNGDRILPEGWVDAAFKPSFLFTDEQKAVGPAASLKLAGYGYSWWIGADGAAAALGFAGQRIWIDRKENLAIVTFSAFPQPPYETNGPDREAEVRLFGEAVREFLRG